jgi:signal transduction histidine kinase
MRLGEKQESAKYYVERPLSFIYQGLKLNTIINRIPTSQSTRFFYFLIGFIILVVVFSFLGLYRLGLSQIELAQQRTNFVSSVSHELRTPLTSISMYSEMLRSSFIPEPEKMKKYYDFIFYESGRLTRLINNILRLNNISNQQNKVEVGQFSSDSLLDMISKKIEMQLQSNDFTLEINKTFSSLVEVDEDCFTQIVINVVDNAIKFSRESEKKQIDLSFSKEGSRGVFSIRDYGPGIAQDQRSKVFDLFHRAENEITRKTTGTGIGLALVKKLAEQMNAKVELRFPEVGTEFRLKVKIPS